MPVTPTYPGVYIEELSSGVRTIVGVATSITAFIGRALRGPVNGALRIQSLADFERRFGGLWLHSTMSYAVQHYFLNGGTDAIVVRVVHSDDADVQKNASAATLTLAGLDGPLDLEAADPGKWGNQLRARVDYLTRDPEPGEALESLFNLSITDMGIGVVESFRNLSTDPSRPRFVTRVLVQDSRLARVAPGSSVPAQRPNDHPDDFYTSANDDGRDGIVLNDNDVIGQKDNKTGIYALNKTDLFNLLCIPPLTRELDVGSATWNAARQYCEERRAMLIVDPPSNWGDVAQAEADADALP
jgi:uncharacterized protein